MNVTYIGSLAERRMKFSSSVSVVALEDSDLFNSVSVYVPRLFAEANIVDFDASIVTKDKPAIIKVTVDNYADELKGDLLSQMVPIFREDTNNAVVLYIIVYWDTDNYDESMWEIGARDIAFRPLTDVFRSLYFLSYIKLLFDPTYTGAVVDPGDTPALMHLNLVASGDVTLTAGTYTVTQDTADFSFVLSEDVTLGDGDVDGLHIAVADATGSTTAPATGATLVVNDDTGTPVADVLASVVMFLNGTVAGVTRASTYFDMALAMAYLAKTSAKLSTFWAVARIDYDLYNFTTGADSNVWKGRSLTAGEESQAIEQLDTGDRSAYFWGALKLMEADNTFLATDCEIRNVPALILREWFAAKNSAGEYVGNKLSLLRITGQKCMGPVSTLNSLYNAGDSAGYDIFEEKNIGCLCPISASSDADSYLSMCRSVTGFPINALMIAKAADYASSQACADMITDKGTLTNPVLTNEEAYKKIQNITLGNIMKYSGTKRITNIVSKFPEFTKAKTGLTSLEAASSWTAKYVDDLDEVTVSGGITAE